MFYLLVALVVGAGLIGMGYLLGRNSASHYDRVRRRQHKEAVSDLDDERSVRLESDRKVEVATRALNQIVRNSGIAEVTAAMALKDMNNN